MHGPVYSDPSKLLAVSSASPGYLPLGQTSCTVNHKISSALFASSVQSALPCCRRSSTRQPALDDFIAGN